MINMSMKINVSDLRTEELEEYEGMLYNQILDLRYIENHLLEIEEDLNAIYGHATNIFEDIPESFPNADTEAALEKVAEKRETLENKHRKVEEELDQRHRGKV